jgi:hypothetical protein
VLREVHIPPGSPALLPIYGFKPTLANLFRIRRLPDPAGPFQKFSKNQRTISLQAQKEIAVIQDWLRRTRKPRDRKLALFARSGTLEYTLKFLFENRADTRFTQKRIEKRIAEIRSTIDGGGPNPDPDRDDCAGVRIAIHRLPDSFKLRCTNFLNYNLNTTQS